MVAGVRVSFGLVKDEVTPALDRQNKGYKTSKRAIGEIQGSYKQLEREAVRALKRAGDEQVRLNRVTVGLNRLVKDGVISQQAANRAIANTKRELQGTNPIVTRLTQSAASYLATWVSIQGAISLATRLLQKQREVEERGAQEILTVAAGQAQARRNIAGATDEEVSQFFASVERIAAKVDTASRGEVFGAAGRAVSATSGLFEDRLERVASALENAIKLVPEDPSQINQLTQIILDLTNVTRSIQQGPGISDAEAVELLLRAGGQSRITETENLKRLIPALATAQVSAGTQFSRRDIEAVLAFEGRVGNLAVDPSGEKTETASALFVRTLFEEVPKVLAVGFAEQLEQVFDDPSLQRRVAANLKGKGATKGAVELITTVLGEPGFRDVLTGVTTEGASVAADIGERTRELRQSRAVRTTQAEVSDFTATRFGDAGIIRQLIEQAADVVGGRAIGQVTNFDIQKAFRGPEAAADLVLNALLQIEESRQARGDETAARAIQVLEDIRSRIEKLADPTPPPPQQARTDQTQVQPPETGD